MTKSSATRRAGRIRRHNPGEFDTFLFADYSGARDERAQEAAIALWRQNAGTTFPRRLLGPFTREALRDRIVDELRQATQENRRVLFGIDHQWSWPYDMWQVAGIDTDLSWRDALTKLCFGSERLPPLGAPHEFAAAFNRASGTQVFYSNVRRFAARYGIPTRPRWNGQAQRLTETVMRGAKPANRLGGTGAVGGQTMEGLRQLKLLIADAQRLQLPLKVWPFDTLSDAPPFHIGAEIYPGHCKRWLRSHGVSVARPGMSGHDIDAASVCLWAQRAPLRELLDLSHVPAQVRGLVLREGWILGAEPLSGVPVATSALARTSVVPPKRSRT